MTRRSFLGLLLLTSPVLAQVPAQGTEDHVVTRFRVQVPEAALLRINGERMNTPGVLREFDAPPLPAGKMYRYEFRVMYAGQEIVREVRFRAGPTVDLDFRNDFAPAVDNKEERRPFRPLRPLDGLPRRTYA